MKSNTTCRLKYEIDEKCWLRKKKTQNETEKTTVRIQYRAELTNNICNNQDMRKANGPVTNILSFFFKIKNLYRKIPNRPNRGSLSI